MTIKYKRPNKKAQAWIKALLSGEYKQAKGKLKKGRGFCCLGVAANIENPAGWRSKKGHPLAFDEKNEMLSEKYWQELTKGAINPCRPAELAEANDCGMTFKQIVNKYIRPMWRKV